MSFFQPAEGERDEPPRQGGADRSAIRVSADSILYEEDGRRAIYRGGVELHRGRLRVLSDELEAYFGPDESAGSGTEWTEKGPGERPSAHL